MRYEKRIAFKCTSTFKAKLNALLVEAGAVNTTTRGNYKHGLSKFVNSLFENEAIYLGGIEKPSKIKKQNNKSNYQQLIDLSKGQLLEKKNSTETIDLEVIAKSLLRLDAQLRVLRNASNDTHDFETQEVTTSSIFNAIDELVAANENKNLDELVIVNLTQNNFEKISELNSFENSYREVIVKKITFAKIYRVTQKTTNKLDLAIKAIYERTNTELIHIYELIRLGHSHKKNLAQIVLQTEQALKKEIQLNKKDEAKK